MTVTAVTPPDAASDPRHPDHDRWVKEYTLKMEVDHAKLVGLPLRVAEAENVRMLERSEQLAKIAPTPTNVTKGSAEARADRHRERGIERRAPAAETQPKGCICGRCVMCKRNIRVMAIIERKRAGDVSMRVLWSDLTSASMAASAGVAGFKGLSKQDTKRKLLATVDAICDRSTILLGPWR